MVMRGQIATSVVSTCNEYVCMCIYVYYMHVCVWLFVCVSVYAHLCVWRGLFHAGLNAYIWVSSFFLPCNLSFTVHTHTHIHIQTHSLSHTQTHTFISTHTHGTISVEVSGWPLAAECVCYFYILFLYITIPATIAIIIIIPIITIYEARGQPRVQE